MVLLPHSLGPLHGSLNIKLVARHGVSHPHAANDQALGALRVVATPSIPKSLKMAMSLAVSLTPPKVRKAVLKRTMPKQARVRSRPRAMNRMRQRVKTSRSTHTPRTPPLVLVNPSESMRTLTQSLTLGRKSRPHGKSSTRTAPRKDSSKSSSSEEEPPTDEVLQDKARQKAWLLDTRFDAWHHDKIANNVRGWAMRDTMICDLPKHGKTQPNHPNPVGPPLGYLAKCKVFDCI